MTTKSIKFALLAISALGAGGTVFANTLPQGGVVQQGAAGIQYNGDTLNINQQSDKAIIDWKDFSVGRDNTVNFNQPSSDSATLNRVTGDFTSEIAGRINSNGSVFLVNPNGIRITADGVIDTGGFVASTLDIDNNDFLNGDYTFTKSGSNGVVSNRGSISVDDGGFVALLGGAVKNDGTVRALVGKVGFAGGEKIVMSFGNNDFLRVEVPTDKWDSLTDSQGNKVAATLDLGGTIDSRGGFIDITVADASDILRQTISIDGIVSANTVSSTDGVISISGGTVGITSSGRITADADYGDAGTIAIEADSIDSSGMVSAVAQNGIGGKIKISLQQGANLNASTRFDVSGGSRGGSLSFIGGLSGKGGTKVLGSADFKADSAGGNGGTIDISTKGGLVGLLSGTVSASGKTQGGRIRLGGAFQGGGYDPKTSQLDKRTQNLFVTRWGDNNSLVSAGKTSLGTGVRIDVSSQSGTGGTAILWADHTTNNYAAIDATGATGGGAVEISGKKRVDSFGLNRVTAGNGVILLDPKNVVVGKWASPLGQIKKISNGASSASNINVALNKDDYFGSSISLSDDGSKMAVGAGGTDGNKGAVYLYEVSGSTWGGTIVQNKKIANNVTITGYNGSAKDLALSGQFGSSVSLSKDGSKLAVGAYGYDSYKGAVYLFTVGGAKWGDTITESEEILTHDASVADVSGGKLSLSGFDNFGSGVSLSGDGNKLAVGAMRSGRKGRIYLFTIGGVKWGDTITQKENFTYGGSGDNFGNSVSLSDNGEKLAIGASIYKDESGLDADRKRRGAVYLFTVDWSNGNTVEKLKISNDLPGVSLSENDNFGFGVSLSNDGKMLAVSASYDDAGDDSNGNANRGAVYLYTVTWGDSSATILQVKKITNSDITGGLKNNDTFGSAVSLSAYGTKLAVGANGDDSGKNGAGAVYLINVRLDVDDYKQQLEQGTHVTLFASNDITINNAINATKGKLTLIAGRSIDINADVKVNGGLVLKANDASSDNTGFVLNDRDNGKAHITVATGKTISGGNDDLIIKMLKGSNSAADNKKQTGKITVWKADGKRVSIVHAGTTKTGDTPSDSEIVILSSGEIKATGNLNKGDIAIELAADKFTNQSNSAALNIDDTTGDKGRFLIWTKSADDNTLKGIISDFTQYKTHNNTQFYSNDGTNDDQKYKSGFLYRPVSSGDSGGGGGGGGGGAAIVLIGAGVAVVAMGGIGGGAAATGATGAGAGGASGGLAAPVGSIDTLFTTGIYAYLNGIDMQAIYQPPTQPSVFNTPHKVTYKAKIHRTYDMTLLAHNIKAQKAVPLYELDEQLYETLRRIFVQQSTTTDKTARMDRQNQPSETL